MGIIRLCEETSREKKLVGLIALASFSEAAEPIPRDHHRKEQQPQEPINELENGRMAAAGRNRYVSQRNEGNKLKNPGHEFGFPTRKKWVFCGWKWADASMTSRPKASGTSYLLPSSTAHFVVISRALSAIYSDTTTSCQPIREQRAHHGFSQPQQISTQMTPLENYQRKCRRAHVPEKSVRESMILLPKQKVLTSWELLLLEEQEEKTMISRSYQDDSTFFFLS